MSFVRKRARDMGIAPGILPPGKYNAITDVQHVRVGHLTVIEGDDIRTGATTILPHAGNIYRAKVPAGVAVGNGFGKLMGSTQIVELGEIESPIVLTNTLCVARAADAVIDWVMDQPGNDAVTTVNPVVGETNDSKLNNIRRRILNSATIRRSIDDASDGPVTEGSVGAGTGTIAFGWKGGIGTSSRVVSKAVGGWTIGVLVQSNFGGVLQVMGIPVGQMLGRYHLKDQGDGSEDGSIMIIIATDAPLSDRNLTRLARRGLFGMARTGASFSNSSGDYAIAFSTNAGVRRCVDQNRSAADGIEQTNDNMSSIFQAALEATEEAILNSLFTATTITGFSGFVGEGIPLEPIEELISGNHKHLGGVG